MIGSRKHIRWEGFFTNHCFWFFWRKTKKDQWQTCKKDKSVPSCDHSFSLRHLWRSHRSIGNSCPCKPPKNEARVVESLDKNMSFHPFLGHENSSRKLFGLSFEIMFHGIKMTWKKGICQYLMFHMPGFVGLKTADQQTAKPEFATQGWFY